MGKKVLIADDDPDAQGLLRHILVKEGYEVASCDDGRDVCGSILATKPDLLILDVMLPGIDGCSLLGTRLSKEEATKRLPILVVSALETTRPVFAKYEQVSGYLTKPFKKAELLDSVRRAIR